MFLHSARPATAGRAEGRDDECSRPVAFTQDHLDLAMHMTTGLHGDSWWMML